ncbi:MAG: class I SAM-dependent methyltransferase [bacterium]|nr:class I SAM-dependent methyltransferase [bacterium]
MKNIRGVGYADDGFEKAQEIASNLNLVLDQYATSCLFVDNEKVSLKLPGFSLLYADFDWFFWQKRKNEGKKQGIVRACKPNKEVKIIDATAGWGRDAAVLASFGADVLMLERNPVMASLLADALVRQSESDKQHMKLSLHHGDAYSYLNRLEQDEYPDIIYIDPMHPERSKAALVKKDMQALQQMIGVDADALQLIELAITRVKKRVIVKWPQKVKALLPSSDGIAGKTVRFDFYLPKDK